MELSPIETDKIQLIINKFEAEKRELENYCDLQERLEQISLLCFMKNVESIVDKLFYVTVKICDTVSDWSTFDFCTDVNKSGHFYVIQIHTSQLLQNKLINNNWIANISIKNSNLIVYKTIHLKNLMPNDICHIIIPFPKSLLSTTVETRLISKVNSNVWSIIKLSTISTNISYHLVPLHQPTILKQPYSPLFEISKLYTDHLKLNKSESIFEYKFNCHANVRQFVEVLLKNCVHKLSVPHMQTLAGTVNGVTDIVLVIHDKDATLTLDTENKILKISASPELCYMIKDYLITNFKDDNNRKLDHLVLIKIQNLRKQLHIEKNQDFIFEHLKIIYEKYKNIVAELPL